MISKIITFDGQELRMTKGKENNSEELVFSVIRGIQEKKGERIVWIDLQDLEHAVTNHFIVCSGRSKTQVDSIAESVVETVKSEVDIRPLHKEGQQNAQWILLDYIDVVVHIFQDETRHFYDLESLWADGKTVAIEED
jgi:ribosome-associated protein